MKSDTVDMAGRRLSVFSSILAAGHSRLIGCKFLPMLPSLPGFGIGMIIVLCHLSGICQVEIDRWKMLMR